jgi:hypothetical protein
MGIYLEVGDVYLERTGMSQLRKVVEKNEIRTIQFKGRYAIYREFGITPVDINKDFLAELTKQFMDSGEEHEIAVQEALRIIEDISENGLKPHSFVRFPLNTLLAAIQSSGDSPPSIDEFVSILLDEINKKYKLDSVQLNQIVPLIYDVSDKE